LTVDAAIPIDAGVDSATGDASAEADAESADLIDSGAVPVTAAGISEIPASYQCAPLVSGDTATGPLNPITLTNYDHYVLAVAAVDSLGNLGAVGNLVCGTPGPIQDFWFDYVADGGQAGGGYCALEGVGVPAGSCLGAGVGLAAIGLARRRRRGHSSAARY
jgi:hypothetical protein